MTLMTSDAKLFGLDLRGLSSELREAWQALQRLPLLSRLLPASMVQVWVGAQAPIVARAQGVNIECLDGETTLLAQAQYTAVLLEDDQVLQRVLKLPQMGPTAMRGAIELDVQTMTPFAPQDTLWAYAVRPAARAGALLHVEVVLASRAQVEQVLRQRASSMPEGVHPEVWAPTSGSPVVLPGFGETSRWRGEAKRGGWIGLGVIGVLVMALALAVTPTAQLRLRAVDAGEQFSRLSKSTSEVVAQRQALVEGVQDLGKLQERVQQQINHLQVLATLTKVLPDDTAAQRVVFRGSKLTVQGLTNNASNVVALLAKTPGFQEVRLPTAVTRVPGSGKESFTLEANIDPQVLGMLAKAEEDKPPAEGGAIAKEVQ
jgi:general secretion pathway protein L